MVEKMIRESVIDRQVQTTDITGIGFDKTYGWFIATCFTGVLKNAGVIVKTIHHTGYAVVAAIRGKPQTDIAATCGNIEKSDLTRITSVHVGNDRLAQNLPDAYKKPIDMFKIVQGSKQQTFVGRSIIHQFCRHGTR